MPNYVKDFENGYKIQEVFSNKIPDKAHGNIYDFRSDVEQAHPGAEIMTGYCVIDYDLGLIPASCHDWNDTLEDAMQDYEDHIVPLLDREEDVELNSTELDEHGNVRKEVLYTVKNGWLQDYLGVDNSAQLEAFLTNSEEWDPTEILADARKEPDLSGLSEGEATEYASPTKENLTPYRIAITETYKKEVVIYAEDELSAEQLAADLCSKDTITFDADNFHDRSTECLGIARSSDLSIYEVYGQEKPAQQAEAILFDDISVFYQANQLMCRFPEETHDRFLRSRIQDIGEGDAFLVGNEIYLAEWDAHQNLDEPDEPWIVYDDSGNPWFEEDIRNPESIVGTLKKEPLTVNRTTLIRHRPWENTSWSNDFWIDASKVPSKVLFEQAVHDYLNTAAGKLAIEFTCNDFNWGDAMMYVPENIWNRHGIYPLDYNRPASELGLAPTSSEHLSTIQVDQDEVLIPDESSKEAITSRPLTDLIASAGARAAVPEQSDKSTKLDR